MKTIQMIVSIPPHEVLRRLSSAIDEPSLKIVGVGPIHWAGKDFIGSINGNQFSVYVRRKWSKRSLAPNCSGNVEPHGSGSRINISIGLAKGSLTCFMVFGVVFVLIFGIGFGFFSLFGLTIAFALPPSERPAAIIMALLPLLAPITVAAIFVLIFLFGKFSGASEEKKLAELFQNLFRDVAVPLTPSA
jgi:hypothetical protein